MNKGIIDGKTGKARSVPMTPEEIEQYERDQIEGARIMAELGAAEAQQAADLAVIEEAAKSDPRFAALARLSGARSPGKDKPPKPK